MKGFVDGIDWYHADAMKYWSFPSSYTKDKKAETMNLVYSGDYIGAIKVDGYYERIIKDEDGNCFMVARNRNSKGEMTEKLAWVPHIQPWLDSLPNGTVLLTECYLPGNEGSKKITSILGCLQEKAIKRQEEGQKLHFYVFDVMALAGGNFNDEPFSYRVEAVKALADLNPSEFVEYAVYYEGKELWNQLQTALANGREGMVIMRKDAPVYFKRTPARVSLKIKKELQDTIDCFFTGRISAPTVEYTGKEIETWEYWEDNITGEKKFGKFYKDYYDGAPLTPVTKSYFIGMAGSLEIGIVNKNGKVKPIGWLSGLTDEIKMNPEKYKGKVIEVAAMEYDKESGGLRHAKMIGWRPDKTWKDCDWNER